MPALLLSAYKLLTGLPWWVYAIAAAVAFHFYDRGAYADRQVEAAKVAWAASQKRAQERGDAIANAKLAELQRQVDSNREHAQAKLEAQEKDAAAKLAALKGAFPRYVTPTQLARCPDVPRGLLRYGADLAAFANGGDPAGTPPAADADDAPSGVSVPAIADALAGQAGAYRSCRDRVAAWEQHATDLNRWCSSVIDILRAAPK